MLATVFASLRAGFVAPGWTHALAAPTVSKNSNFRSQQIRMDTGLPEDYNYEYVLAFATRVAQEAGQQIIDSPSPELGLSDALQHLDFELAHEPAVSISAKWVSHVDEQIVSVALVDATHGPVLGAVSRPGTNETLCAALNSGAFVQHADGSLTPCPPCGCAAVHANIVHVPHERCPELDRAIDSLMEMMPTEVTRVPCCCCCEGLFEVVSGRADAHLSPPESHGSPGQQRTPVPVLCAFAVLLEESGGMMTDVYGDEIDLCASLAAGAEHRGGLLAAATATHNYLLHRTTWPFELERLVLPRLATQLSSSAPSFQVEYVGGEERIVQDVADAWTFDAAFDAAGGEFELIEGLDDDWTLPPDFPPDFRVDVDDEGARGVE